MTHIDDLSQLGTSTWLDDLSRDRIISGNLAEVIDSKSIVGVTTNPTIFATAMSVGTAYDAQIEELKGKGAGLDDGVYAMMIDDVRDACDLFTPIHQATNGRDGRVSIEVDPSNLPEHIDVDVTELQVAKSLHVSDIQLPTGVTVLDDPGLTVASVQPPRVQEATEDEVAEAPAAGEPELIRKPKDEDEA